MWKSVTADNSPEIAKRQRDLLAQQQPGEPLNKDKIEFWMLWAAHTKNYRVLCLFIPETNDSTLELLEQANRTDLETSKYALARDLSESAVSFLTRQLTLINKYLPKNEEPEEFENCREEHDKLVTQFNEDFRFGYSMMAKDGHPDTYGKLNIETELAQQLKKYKIIIEPPFALLKENIEAQLKLTQDDSDYNQEMVIVLGDAIELKRQHLDCEVAVKILSMMETINTHRDKFPPALRHLTKTDLVAIINTDLTQIKDSNGNPLYHLLLRNLNEAKAIENRLLQNVKGIADNALTALNARHENAITYATIKNSLSSKDVKFIKDIKQGLVDFIPIYDKQTKKGPSITYFSTEPKRFTQMNNHWHEIHAAVKAAADIKDTTKLREKIILLYNSRTVSTFRGINELFAIIKQIYDDFEGVEKKSLWPSFHLLLSYQSSNKNWLDKKSIRELEILTGGEPVESSFRPNFGK